MPVPPSTVAVSSGAQVTVPAISATTVLDHHHDHQYPGGVTNEPPPREAARDGRGWDRPRGWPRFLALLLVAVLSITAFATERVYANQSVASTTRSLAAEVDSFEKAAVGTGSATLEPTTVAYLQSRVLPQGETIMVRLPGGTRLGSAGSAGLLQNPTIRSALSTPPPTTRSYRSTLDGVDTLYRGGPDPIGQLLPRAP